MTLLIDMLYSIDSWPEIIAVTETRLNSNSISNVDLPNYNFFHVDSPTLAGGTAIYVKGTIKAIPRPELEIDLSLIESCWVEIDPCNKKKHIMIGCIYKHPSANVDEFTTVLDKFLLYASVTNTKAYATLVTEHNFSGYVLFNLFLFVFHVISVNVDNVIFCK